MARAAGFVLAALFSAGMAVSAQAQTQQMPSPFSEMMKGTPDEQAACAPDSNRFCRRFEPDAMQVLGCLQQNRQKLNAACQRVLQNLGV